MNPGRPGGHRSRLQGGRPGAVRPAAGVRTRPPGRVPPRSQELGGRRPRPGPGGPAPPGAAQGRHFGRRGPGRRRLRPAQTLGRARRTDDGGRPVRAHPSAPTRLGRFRPSPYGRTGAAHRADRPRPDRRAAAVGRGRPRRGVQRPAARHGDRRTPRHPRGAPPGLPPLVLAGPSGGLLEPARRRLVCTGRWPTWSRTSGAVLRTTCSCTLLSRVLELELAARSTRWTGSAPGSSAACCPSRCVTASTHRPPSARQARKCPGPRHRARAGTAPKGSGGQAVRVRSWRDFQPSSADWAMKNTPPPVAYTDSTSSEGPSPAAWML